MLERIQQGGIGEGGCRDHARAICRVDLVTNKTKQKQDVLTMLDLFSILSFSLSVVSSLNLVGKRNGVKGGEEKFFPVFVFVFVYVYVIVIAN